MTTLYRKHRIDELSKLVNDLTEEPSVSTGSEITTEEEPTTEPQNETTIKADYKYRQYTFSTHEDTEHNGFCQLILANMNAYDGENLKNRISLEGYFSVPQDSTTQTWEFDLNLPDNNVLDYAELKHTTYYFLGGQTNKIYKHYAMDNSDFIEISGPTTTTENEGETEEVAVVMKHITVGRNYELIVSDEDNNLYVGGTEDGENYTWRQITFNESFHGNITHLIKIKPSTDGEDEETGYYALATDDKNVFMWSMGQDSYDTTISGYLPFYGAVGDITDISGGYRSNEGYLFVAGTDGLVMIDLNDSSLTNYLIDEESYNNIVFIDGRTYTDIGIAAGTPQGLAFLYVSRTTHTLTLKTFDVYTAPRTDCIAGYDGIDTIYIMYQEEGIIACFNMYELTYSVLYEGELTDYPLFITTDPAGNIYCGFEDTYLFSRHLSIPIPTEKYYLIDNTQISSADDIQLCAALDVVNCPTLIGIDSGGIYLNPQYVKYSSYLLNALMFSFTVGLEKNQVAINSSVSYQDVSMDEDEVIDNNNYTYDLIDYTENQEYINLSALTLTTYGYDKTRFTITATVSSPSAITTTSLIRIVSNDFMYMTGFPAQTNLTSNGYIAITNEGLGVIGDARIPTGTYTFDIFQSLGSYFIFDTTIPHNSINGLRIYCPKYKPYESKGVYIKGVYNGDAPIPFNLQVPTYPSPTLVKISNKKVNVFLPDVILDKRIPPMILPYNTNIGKVEYWDGRQIIGRNDTPAGNNDDFMTVERGDYMQVITTGEYVNIRGGANPMTNNTIMNLYTNKGIITFRADNNYFNVIIPQPIEIDFTSQYTNLEFNGYMGNSWYFNKGFGTLAMCGVVDIAAGTTEGTEDTYAKIGVPTRPGALHYISLNGMTTLLYENSADEDIKVNTYMTLNWNNNYSVIHAEAETAPQGKIRVMYNGVITVSQYTRDGHSKIWIVPFRDDDKERPGKQLPEKL